MMKCIQEYACGKIFDGILCLDMLKPYCLIYTFIRNALAPELHPQKSRKVHMN